MLKATFTVSHIPAFVSLGSPRKFLLGGEEKQQEKSLRSQATVVMKLLLISNKACLKGCKSYSKKSVYYSSLE